MDRRRTRDRTSPAGDARVEPGGCLEAAADGEEEGAAKRRWEALFWVWDSGSGLSRVRVVAAPDPDTRRKPTEAEAEDVYYRWEANLKASSTIIHEHEHGTIILGTK